MAWCGAYGTAERRPTLNPFDDEPEHVVLSGYENNPLTNPFEHLFQDALASTTVRRHKALDGTHSLGRRMRRATRAMMTTLTLKTTSSST